MQKMWFKTKNYGWGWVPVSWEGWVATIFYILGIVYILLERDRDALLDNNSWVNLAIKFVLITVIFLIIAYKKGGEPKWQWGEDK